jgi:hypothetical protein
MAMRHARVECADTLGTPASDKGGAAPADHALATLALFEVIPVCAVRDHEQDLSLGHFDTALLFCSQLVVDASDVPLLYALLAPRARDAVVAALQK